MTNSKATEDLKVLLGEVDREEYLQHSSEWEKIKWTQTKEFTYKGKGKKSIESGKQLKKLFEHLNFPQNIDSPVTRKKEVVSFIVLRLEAHQ